MSERICDACGKRKKLRGGKTCEKRHFICRDCVRVDGFISVSTRTRCPTCDKPLK